jgi:hypothetical protein
VRLCLCSLETHRRVLSLRRNVSTPPCPCNHQRASIMQIGIMDPDKRLSWPGLLPDAVDLVCGETAINYAVTYADMRACHHLSNALTLCLVQSPCRAQEHSCATAPGPVSRPVRPGHLTLRDTRGESSSLLDEQQNNMVSLAERILDKRYTTPFRHTQHYHVNPNLNHPSPQPPPPPPIS